jgi:preprotein translocase subunit SecD
VRAVWLVLVAVLALAGCTTEVTGTPVESDSPVTSDPPVTSESPAAGPVDLVVPIELRPVVEDGGVGTTVLPDPNGERLALADPVMTIDRLDGAEVQTDGTGAGWVLTIDLTDEDAASFATWTADHVGERLAMVVDGEVLVAPTIQGAITEGMVSISGDYTRDEIDALLDKITGR